MNAYLDGMKRYATFSGRSTRAQYWLFNLFFLIWLFIGFILDEAAGTATPEGGGVLTGIIVIAHVLPALAVFVRRMHDIDRSGWWLLISVIPLIGLIVQLIFLCTPSTNGSNRFGPPSGHQASVGNSSMPSQQSDTLAQLEKLAALKASGAIDDTEFSRMKAQVLSGTAR